MKYNELQAQANQSSRRVGRGIAAGQGKTAGRGTKGQKSRAGSSRRPGFEGGQNPIIKRFPKLRGFKSHRPKTEAVYIEELQGLSGTVDSQVLADKGLISSPYVRVKIIGDHKLDKKIMVKASAISAGALASIKKAGGTFESVSQLGRKSNKKTNKK